MQRRPLETLVVLSFALACAFPQAAAATVAWVKPSLVTSDHTSEGVLLSPAPDKLINVFRLDEGVAGAHAANSGRIGIRQSLDGGQTWGLSQALDPSAFDDRNITGYLQGGEIRLLFREYDATKKAAVGLFGLSTFDNGFGWGQLDVLKPLVAPSLAAEAPGAVAFVPARGWLATYYDVSDWSQHSVLSVDGVRWDFSLAETLPVDPGLRTSESALAYLGSDRVLCVFRQENHQGSFYSMLSVDGGRTWGDVRAENSIPSWTSAPDLVVSGDGQRVYLLLGERRAADGNEVNRGCAIRILTSTPDRLAADPADWDFYGAVPRPWPSDAALYGYPTSAALSDGRHLVVFTDRGKDVDGSERASLFQFVLEDAQGNPDGPSLVASAPANVRGGAPFSVSATLYASNDAPVNDVVGTLQLRSTSGSWVSVGSTKTVDGTWSMVGTSYYSASWRVITGPTPGGHTCGFGPFKIVPSLTISTPAFAKPPTVNSRVRVTATMMPTLRTEGPVTLIGEYRYSTGWKRGASWRMSTTYLGNRKSALASTIALAKKGYWRFKVVASADVSHSTSSSPYRTVTVR